MPLIGRTNSRDGRGGTDGGSKPDEENTACGDDVKGAW